LTGSIHITTTKIVNVYPLHPYLTFTIFQNGMWWLRLIGEAVG
jgi:hypothetical protein